MRKTQLQALLVIAGIGAALALIQLLGVAGGLVGVGLLVVSTILTAPDGDGQDMAIAFLRRLKYLRGF